MQQPVLTSRNLLLVLVSTAGAATGALLLPRLEAGALQGVAVLAGLAIAAELFGTALFADRTRVSAGWVPVLAAGMLFGPSGVVLPAAAVALGYLVRRRPLTRVAFNFGQGLLAAVAASAAFGLLTAELAFWGEDVLAAALAGVLLWAIATLLVSAMVSLDTERPFVETVIENFAWLPAHFAAGGVVALALSSAWSQQGLPGLAAFVLPVIALGFALRQGANKARPAIVEARLVRLQSTQLERLLRQRDALAEELRSRAFHDALTGLPNRALFFDRLEQAIDAARRAERAPSVAFIDLDRFKAVNDRLGHGAGDRVLREAAARIQGNINPGDTVARYGGDEFVVLMHHDASFEEIEALAGRILAALVEPVEVDGASTAIPASLGIAHWQPTDRDANEFLRRADIALYRAKQEGRGRVVVYDEFEDKDPLLRLDLEQDLARALERDELFVDYQPLVDLESRSIRGFEALVRWEHPQRGLIEPGVFIPIADETGQVGAVGERVLLQACAAAKTWATQAQGAAAPKVSVNVSPRQLTLPNFVATVRAALGKTGLDPGLLTLEVTESAVLGDLETASQTLGQLKQLGVQIALDDYGTAYSSMSYLHQLPIDVLKLDRSFVPDLASDHRLRSIVGSLHQVARTLGLVVVAEGVEREEDVAILKTMGCELGQGFHLGPPMDEAAAGALIARASQAEPDRDQLAA